MENQSTFRWWWLNAEMWIAARCLPVAIFFRNFSEILKYADTKACNRYIGISANQIASAAIKVIRRPWIMRERRCLRQGLIGYRYLRKAGYKPQLHFGIDPGSIDQEHISAHCWVVLDGQPVVNDALQGMSTIHIHPTENTSTKT